MPKRPGTPNATEKIVAILECVAGPGMNKKPAEIAALLDLDRATVYRLAGQLAELDMLYIHPDTRRISMGPRAYHIGYAYIRGSSVAARVHTYLEETARKMPMIISFAIADRRIREGLIFDLFNINTMDQWGVRYEEGIYKPVNHGSHGRVLMAFHQPEEEIERIIRSIPLAPVGRKSFTDPDLLLEEYALVRAEGMAVGCGVSMLGINDIAIPVRTRDGRVIASVSADVAADRWGPAKKSLLINIVSDCVHKIERLFPDGVDHWAWL